MKKLFIFGTKKNAEMALFYFRRDRPDLHIAGFVEDLPSSSDCYGLPVLDSETFISLNDPSDCLLFAPLTSSSGRQSVFNRFKALGFSFASYISPNATIWDVGAVGEHCFIQEGNNIQFGTTVGNNCLMWAGNHIGHHGRVGNHVTFTSHVVLSGSCSVGDTCYFGVNSTIGDGLVVGDRTFIGMGSLVTKSLAKPGIYLGSPAKWVRDSAGTI